MKRKKLSEKASFFVEGSFDPPDDAQRKESYFVKALKPKLMLFLTTLCCFLATGSAEKVECSAGYYCVQGVEYDCPEGFFSRDGEVDCTICPHGYACQNPAEEPIKCEEGYFTQGGSTKCEKCTAGYTCTLVGNVTLVELCPGGTYSLEGGNVCLPSPKGYMITSPSSKPEECTDGYYSTNENATSCHLCPRGHQCKNKAQEPVICEEGTYSGPGSMKCEPCPIGYRCEEGCGNPTICDKDDHDCHHPTQRRGLATSCFAGYYWDGVDTCLNCPEGYRCTGGTNAPVACGAGQYSGFNQGSGACTTCSGNNICPTKRASDVYSCQSGFVKTNNLYCKPCPEGYRCDGSDTPVICTDGTNYSYGGVVSTCTGCPTGHECHPKGYCSLRLGSVLKTGIVNYCPVQTECPGAGRTTYNDCTLNNAWAAPKSSSCTTCEVDHECFVGYSVECPSTHFSTSGDFECHPCPEGKYCNSPRTSQGDCATGQYSPAGSVKCYH